MPEETICDNSTIIKKQEQVQVTSKPKTVRRSSGGASDIFEIAETGTTKSKKVHQVYRKHDSIEDVAKTTVDLVADSTKEVAKEVNRQCQDNLDIILDKTYTPRQQTAAVGDLDNVIASLHTF